MSKTPRTDEREFAAIDLKPSARVVYASFARQLERELADKDRQLAEAKAEIEHKDKRIEQMREALNLMLEGAIYNFHYVCQHRDNCLCWDCQKVRVKAALAADLLQPDKVIKQIDAVLQSITGDNQ